MGLKLIDSEQYKEIIVIGDSKLIIKGVRKHSRKAMKIFTRNIQRILKEDKRFKGVEYHHVLITLNPKEYILAKEACGLEQGMLRNNQVLETKFLP
jgi:ribonuclease HI